MMKHSLTYYILLFILRLKGLKQDFSRDPVDFKKLRSSDVYLPKSKFFKQNLTREFKVLKTDVTEVRHGENSKQLLIFIHGGAFVSGPAQHHWDTIEKIAKQISCTIWMCNYPKAPEHQILEISNNIDAVYQKALQSYAAEEISLIGDSVGATLIIALIQREISNDKKPPRKIILVSPVMDATMSNPEISNIDSLDPMLSLKGVVSAKKMCVGILGLDSPLISPINGKFNGFPPTILFLAENDITYPDQKILIQKMKTANNQVELFVGSGMPHIWPFLPIMKESKTALNHLIQSLRT